MNHRSCCTVILSCVIALSGGTADAATVTWTGAAGATWNTTSTGWSGATGDTPWDATYGPSNIADFNTSGGASATVSDTVYTNGILFNKAFSVTGGSISLAGASPTITANAAATIGSSLIGTAGLTKNGTGILTLAASNPYQGSTTISSGTLTLANQNAVQNSTVTMAGGMLNFNATGGTAFSVGGLSASTFIAGTQISLQNTASIPIVLAVGGNNENTTFAGRIGGTGSLVKSGTGTLTLTDKNTHTGGTTVESGTLTLGPAYDLGTICGPLTIKPGATVNAHTTWALGFGGTSAVTSILIEGSTLNFTGGDDWSRGMVPSTVTMSGGSITGSGFAWCNNNTTTPTLRTLASSTQSTIAPVVYLRLGAGGYLTFDVARGTTTDGVDLLVSGGIGIGYLDGGSGIRKIGDGLLVLRGTASYTGATTVNGGTLLFDMTGTGTRSTTSALALGGGTFSIKGKSSGTTGQTMASLSVNAGASRIAIDPNGGTSTTLTITSSTFSPSAGSYLHFDTSAGTPSTAMIAWNPTPTSGILGGGFTMTDNGGIGFATVNTGKVTRYADAMALTDSNPTDPAVNLSTNTTGTITNAVPAAALNSLSIDTSGGTGGSWDLGSGNTATITSGGLLMTGGNNFSIQGGTLKSGTATNSDLIVHQYGTGTLTIGSDIANGNGASSLTKLGPGTLTLGGANAYTGATLVNAGTLQVDGSLSGGGAVTISAGALQVNGSIAAGAAVAVPASTTLGVGSSGNVARDVNVTGGAVNLAGTLGGTMKVTGGAVATLAGSPRVATADFSAPGTGTVNAAVAPLAITTTMKLANDVTVNYTAGGSATSFSVSGANVVNDSQTGANARTLTLSGGTLAMSIPAVGPAVDLRSTANSTTIKSSLAYGGRDPFDTSNWTGMTGTFPTGTHSTDGNSMWLSNNTSGVGTWISWDLGSTRSICKMHVWNYNESTGNRGVKSLDLQVSDDGTNWTNVLTGVDWTNIGSNGTISGTVKAPVAAGYAGFDWTLPSNITGRYIRFNSTLNFTGSGYTGLSEIVFYEAATGLWNAPNTNLAVTASSILNLGAPAATHSLGNLSLSGADTELTISNAAKASFDKIAAASNSSIAGSAIALRSADVTVDSLKTLTVDSAVVDGASATALNKLGAGTLKLTAASTYTGATAVGEGTLLVNNALSGAGGAVTVASGATLGGAGPISRATTIDAGGSIAPGDGGVGPLAIVGDLTINGSYNWEMSSLTSYDSIGHSGGTFTVDPNALLQVSYAGGTWNTEIKASDRVVIASSSSTLPSFDPSKISATGFATGTFATVDGGDGDLLLTYLPTSSGTTMSLSTPLSASVIRGGTASVGVTLTNSGLTTLAEYVLAASGHSSIVFGPALPTPESLANGAHVDHTFTAGTTGSTRLGDNTVTYTATSDGASNSPQTTTGTLTVYDHASPGLSDVTVDFGTAARGSSVTRSTTLNNASGSYLAGLQITGLGGLSDSGTGAIASGSGRELTATIDTSKLGPIDQTYTIAVSDDQGLPGWSALTSQTFRVTGTITGSSGWKGSDSSNWSDDASWVSGIPQSAGDTASFGATGAGTVYVNSATTKASTLSFNSVATPYLLDKSGSGLLTLDNGVGGTATVNVSAGSHEIAAPVTLASATAVDVADSSALTVSGQLTGSSLTKTGPGTLTLTNSGNDYASTTVSGGTLVIGSAGALPAGKSLSIGSGGTLILGGGMAMGQAASAEPVPEPGTLALLIIAGLAGVMVYRVSGTRCVP